MIRCLISLVILFAFGVDLYAQSRILDSLKNELVEAKRDSNYVKTLIELSIQSRSVDAIEAGEYADQAIELAGEVRFERGLMVAYYHKGVSEFILGNYESVSEPLSRCLKISEKREDLQVQFFVNNVLGITYNKIGQATQAIDVLYSSAALALELGDSLNYAIALNNIGEIHFERKDNSKAVQLFEESFEIIQKFGEPFQIGVSSQ